MKDFKGFLITESGKSDRYEKDVADYIDSMDGIKAERPRVSAAYADVKLTNDAGKKTWLEVKMNHTDNLSNPRIFFDGKQWATTYKTPAAKYAVEQINKSKQAKEFIDAIGNFAGIDNPKVPTTKGGLRDPDAIPLDVMKEYFNQPGVNRYIMDLPNIDLGKIVTDHYLIGKAEPATYMSAKDDFYMIGNSNPLNVPRDVPLLSGSGNFRIRVSTRSNSYEVQAEIKIAKMPASKYSVKPGTKKKNPFE